MSLQGTFNTSVQALNAQAQHLSNISTNISNVNTTGYKLQGTHFATLLNRVTPLEKRFFTVDTYDYREVTKQGLITSTERSFDVALNGRRFFVTNKTTNGSGEWQYTRDGSFYGKAVQLTTDSDGDGQLDQGTLLTTAGGDYIYGWAADADGNINQTNNLASLSPIMFSNNSVVASQATSTISLQANISADSSGRQSVGLPFVDASRNSRTLVMGFTANAGNSDWTLDMEAIGTNQQPVTATFNPSTISFSSIGEVLSPTNGQISVTVNDAAGPQTMTVDISQMTQFSDAGAFTVQNIEQDGFLAGRLQNAYFNNNGVLVASYSNGEVRNLYQLPIARFESDNKLEARNGNTYLQTVESGGLQLSALGNAGTTNLVVGALEQSNVDLADQFTKMIVTQRAYSSAATVLRTTDEMTQAARDLKR